MSLNIWYPVCAILNLVVCIGKYSINAFASQADGTLFLNKTGDLSDVYAVEITPAGWTFSIWGFIYTFEMLWVVYSLTLLCRKHEQLRKPLFIPVSVLVINILSCGLNVGWLISFDRQEIVLAFVILVVYSCAYYVMLGLAYRALDKSCVQLVQQGQTKDVWLTRALLHNGLAIQATWVTVATLLNLCMVMQYKADPSVGMTDAATVALSILALEIVVFAATDLFYLDRYSRYTFTPYLVLVVALIGSLTKNYEDGARNSVFTVVLLCLAGAVLFAKIVLSVARHAKHGAFTTCYDNTIGGSASGHLA